MTRPVAEVTQAAATALAAAMPVCTVDSTWRMRTLQPGELVTVGDLTRSAPGRRHEIVAASKNTPLHACASQPGLHRADMPPDVAGRCGSGDSKYYEHPSALTAPRHVMERVAPTVRGITE